MRTNPVAAIVGATGLVGNEILVCLEESKLEFADLRLFASVDSEGEIYSCRDTEYKVERIEDDSFEGVDLALFALNPNLAGQFIPIAVEAGAVVIDSSSCFRGEPGIPLVVAGVNTGTVGPQHKIIASPNPSTVLLSPVLKALHDEAGLVRVVVSAYNGVSGAGKVALDELWSQTLAIFNQREVISEAFQHQIAFNCIPQMDVIRADGYTKEEYRLISETSSVLGIPDMRMTATAVRVPVFHSYAFNVNVQTETELSPERCISVLNEVKAVEISSDPLEYPMPISVTGSDHVHVGRIRRDTSVKYGLDLWIVGDNVRRGAALNMIETAQHIIKASTE